MAAKSLADKMKLYQGRIEAARKWRQNHDYDAVWRLMIDMYKGKQFPKGSSEEDRIAINLMFSTINVIFPSITVNYPKIMLMANSPEMEDRASITEAVINYWWEHYGFQNEFRKAVKDYLMIGHGWVKTRWIYEEDSEERPEDEIFAEIEEQVRQIEQFAIMNPEMEEDLPSTEDVIAQIDVEMLVVREDRPAVERVSPFDMFVDPHATATTEMKWLSQRLHRTVNEVNNDDRYERSARMRVKPTDSTNKDPNDPRRDNHIKDNDDGRVELWEFYDLETNEFCVFAEGSNEFLVKPQQSPFYGGHPFEMIRNYDVPDHFYPIGDLEMVSNLQDELNKTRSQMMNFRKKDARKYLVREASFGTAGRQALESNLDNQLVPVIDDRPFSEVVAPVPQVSMNPEMYNHTETIESNINTVTGVNEYARGNATAGRRTATEASIIQDASNVRVADKLARVEEFISNVARKVVQLAQHYLTEEQVARVVGTRDQVLWIPFKPSDIEGEYDFRVKGGSTQPQNESSRRNEAMMLMQVLAPFVGQFVDPFKLLQYVLREGFGVAQAGKFLMDPMVSAQLAMGGPPLPPGAGGPPPDGGGGGPDGAQPPMGGVAGIPDEIMAQLQGQVGVAPSEVA